MDTSNLSNKYQQKTDKQHILDNPDTYIGSVEKIESNVWVLNEDNTKIRIYTIQKEIRFVSRYRCQVVTAIGLEHLAMAIYSSPFF